MPALLELHDLHKHFGAVAAVAGVDLVVEKGKLHSIIGPNGAGKTTVFNCITGEIEPTRGNVRFEDRDITALPPYALPRLGISRSFQRTSIFPTLTVAQNVWVSAYGTRPSSVAAALKPADTAEGIGPVIQEALGEVGLDRRAEMIAGELSHGEQRLLDFAIALASRPKLLLLDEPTAGLSRSDTQMVIELVERLRRRYTIVLIEHKMDVVMRVSNRISVMHFGKILAEGTPDEIRRNPDVREAYLGRRA
jgi:branched-chain amino acid transport system ATP-binding protein